MDFFFRFDTIKLGRSIVYIQDVSCYKFKKKILHFFLSVDFFYLNKSVDPDEMLQYGSLLFVEIPPFRDSFNNNNMLGIFQCH